MCFDINKIALDKAKQNEFSASGTVAGFGQVINGEKHYFQTNQPVQYVHELAGINWPPKAGQEQLFINLKDLLLVHHQLVEDPTMSTSVMLRVTTHRGSVPGMPWFGSRLHTLTTLGDTSARIAEGFLLESVGDLINSGRIRNVVVRAEVVGTALKWEMYWEDQRPITARSLRADSAPVVAAFGLARSRGPARRVRAELLCSRLGGLVGRRLGGAAGWTLDAADLAERAVPRHIVVTEDRLDIFPIRVKTISWNVQWVE